MYLSM